MAHHPVPLNELAAAVQNAVEQTLAKHGAVPIEKIWIGFVAPDKIANVETAREVANVLSRGGGLAGEPSVGQIGGAAAGGAEAHALLPPHHIIGLVYKPKLAK